MQYQSIVRFLDYCNIEYSNITDFNLSKAKKIINAEFTLQDNSIISIDGFDYTKQEIFTEIERPDFQERLAFHCILWQRKTLLATLEQDRFELEDRTAWMEIKDHPAFISFLSPYFKDPFNKIMNRFLSQQNLTAAAEFLDYLYFIDTYNQESALISTRVFLDESIRLFRNLNDQSYKSRAETLKLWHTASWSHFINKLPDALLPYVDELATAIINFTVRIQKSEKKICYQISSQLILIKHANYSLRELIRSNHDSFRHNYQPGGFFGRLRNGFSFSYILLLLFIAIIRAGISDSCNNHDSETKTAYERKKEVDAFTAERHLYQSEYNRHFQEIVNGLDTEIMTSTPFVNKEIYLRIDGTGDSASKLVPFTIQNNTDSAAEISVITSNQVWYYSIGSKQLITFDVDNLTTRNFDFLIQLNVLPTTPMPKFRQDKKYIHIASIVQPIDAIPNFDDSATLFILNYSELETQKCPLQIHINKLDDSFSVSIKGRGQIINQGSF